MKVKLELIDGNIIEQVSWADAIVNCANPMLNHGGGICGVIFQAAGAKELRELLRPYGTKEEGDCVITDGVKLPCKIIHAVNPRYESGSEKNREILLQTYKNIIKCAEENGIEKIALPLISSSIYRYPLPIASEVAVHFLSELESKVVKEVRLVLYGQVYYLVCKEILEGNDK